LMPLTVVGLVFYFVLPLVRNHPSPGACIAGYQIVADDGIKLSAMDAVMRTLLGFIALCMWPLTPFLGRDRKKGKVWVDKVFRTRAVVLS